MAILVATLIAALGVACALALPAQKAYADTFLADDSWVVSPVEDDNIEGMFPVSFKDEYGYYLTSDEVKIKNAKSSNKKVARVSNDSYGLWLYYGMTTGKSTITFTANGKKYSKVFQVKYICPVSVFKVAGKSELKTFKKKNIFVTKKTLKNKPVVVKAKKGWVITEVSIQKKDKYNTKEFKGKRSYSAKISTVWPYDGITIKFKNKKTDMEQTLTYRKYYDTRYAQAG